jgi:hypothetical protein
LGRCGYGAVALVGDDPNEYNLKCLPAVTVCKGVVSKTHGTFVCEFTTPSELAPPFVEAITMGRVACPFNHSPMPTANFPDLFDN